MGVVHQLVSIIFIAYVVSCYNELKYEVDASLAGRVCPPGQRVFEGTVASFLSCAIASDEAGSAGIAYIKGTLMCYGCDVMSMLQTRGFHNLPGAVFYRRDRKYKLITLTLYILYLLSISGASKNEFSANLYLLLSQSI